MGVGGSEHGADPPEVLGKEEVPPVPDVGVEAGGTPDDIIAGGIGQGLIQIMEEFGSFRCRDVSECHAVVIVEDIIRPVAVVEVYINDQGRSDSARCEELLEGHGDVVEEAEPPVEGAARVMAGRPDEREGGPNESALRRLYRPSGSRRGRLKDEPIPLDGSDQRLGVAQEKIGHWAGYGLDEIGEVPHVRQDRPYPVGTLAIDGTVRLQRHVPVHDGEAALVYKIIRHSLPLEGRVPLFGKDEKRKWPPIVPSRSEEA